MTQCACACCGYIVFGEGPGSYEICPICFWEDDPVQIADPWFSGGANDPSLFEAQVAFMKCGAIEERFVARVRKPTATDRRDPRWRRLDPRDREFVTTPHAIEEDPPGNPQRVPYEYWLRGDALTPRSS